jgi:hypothetical protein
MTAMSISLGPLFRAYRVLTWSGSRSPLRERADFGQDRYGPAECTEV